MAITFRLKALNAPPGQQCLTTLQATLAKVVQYVQVTGPDGASFIVASETEPSADNRDQIWVQLETNGKPKGLFKYQGEWLQIPGLHVGAVIFYNGLVADIPDGWVLADGTNGAPDLTDASTASFAPMWEPAYGIGVTTYTLCLIWHKGFA